jgi:ATP-dependent DNA ligase
VKRETLAGSLSLSISRCGTARTDRSIAHIHEPGDIVFRHGCKLGLEDIVSKRVGSPYRSGRSRDWVTGSG